MKKENTLNKSLYLWENLNIINLNDDKYIKLSFFKKQWISDVLACVLLTKDDEFSLEDLYIFKDILKRKHPENNTIESKIRQQLQFLRDNNIIEFIANNGHYIKLF